MTALTNLFSPYWLGVLLAGSALVLFSSCAIVISIAARRLDSNAGSLISVAVNLPVGILLLLLQLAIEGALAPPSLWGIGAFLTAGIFSTYLGRWLFFKSVELIGPSRASGFQTSSPLVTALLGWVLLGEQLGAMALAGMGLGVMGLIAMSGGAGRKYPGASAQRRAHKHLATRVVLTLGLGASAAYAVSNVLRAAAVREWNEPVAGATLGALAGLIVLLTVTGRRLPAIGAAIRAQPASALMYCGVGAMQITAQTLTIASMKYIPASLAALITMCSPLLVVPVSLLFLRQDEELRPATVAGILMAIAGVAVVTLYGKLR